jgi:hypothetical protein
MVIESDIYMVIKKKPAYVPSYVDKTPVHNGWRSQYVSNFQCPPAERRNPGKPVIWPVLDMLSESPI